MTMRNYLHAEGWLLIAALLAGAAAPTWTGGGVVLIGQPEHFPVSVKQSGNYMAHGQLTVPYDNTSAIEIASGNVIIFIGGHA